MPEHNCDVLQGFNCEPSKSTDAGFINSFTVAGTALATTVPKFGFSVVDPSVVGLATKLEIYAVLSAISWSGQKTDPITMNGQISTANRAILAAMLGQTLTNRKVENLEFTVYSYDREVASYYKCFHSDGVKLTGELQVVGKDVQMTVGATQLRQPVSPATYSFTCSVAAPEAVMALHIATSSTLNYVKEWGGVS
jgi:hypothetical protein